MIITWKMRYERFLGNWDKTKKFNSIIQLKLKKFKQSWGVSIYCLNLRTFRYEKMVFIINYLIDFTIIDLK